MIPLCPLLWLLFFSISLSLSLSFCNLSLFMDSVPMLFDVPVQKSFIDICFTPLGSQRGFKIATVRVKGLYVVVNIGSINCDVLSN